MPKRPVMSDPRCGMRMRTLDLAQLVIGSQHANSGNRQCQKACDVRSQMWHANKGLGLRGHGPCPDGHGDLETELCLSSHKTFVSTMWQNSHSLGKPFVNVLLLGVQGAGPGQIVIDIQYQLKITAFIIPNNFCFNNIAKKIISWDSPWSGPRPWSLRQLDFAQMVMDNLHPYFWNQWTQSFQMIP